MQDDQQKARLARLDARLACAPKTDQSADQHANPQAGDNVPRLNRDTSLFSLATRMATDLLASVAVCLFSAWWLSTWLWLDGRPIILALAGILGIGVGIYTVWRTSVRHFSATPVSSESVNNDSTGDTTADESAAKQSPRGVPSADQKK